MPKVLVPKVRSRRGSRMGSEPALNVVEGTSLLRASVLVLSASRIENPATLSRRAGIQLCSMKKPVVI